MSRMPQPCSGDAQRIDLALFNLIFWSESDEKELAAFILLRDEPSIKASWRWTFG